jgi:ATP-dependent helicase/nuclease subunit A
LQEIKRIGESLFDKIKFLEDNAETAVGKKRLGIVKSFLKICQDEDNGIHIKNVILNYKLVTTDFMPKKLDEYHDLLTQAETILDKIQKDYFDYIHYKSVRFIKDFERYYTEYRKVNSKLSFNDLLFMSSRLLRDNIEVRNYFKRKYKYIFIDETQDTDPMQTELVFFLAEKMKSKAKKWDEVILEPAKLFMVGDPKQSIYKFRRADIKIFNQAKYIINHQGGLILTLNKNFRSDKNIIDFVNVHFAGSFKAFAGAIKNGYQAEYIPIETGKKSKSKVEENIFRIEVEKENKIEDEALKIISVIQRIVGKVEYQIFDEDLKQSRKIKYSDIVMLSRTQTNISEFVRLFEAANIPNVIVGGRTFFDTEDIRGLVFSLQAIDDPNNSIALFGALKSKLFNLSDRDLLEYVSRNYKLSYFQHSEEESIIYHILAFFKMMHYRKNSLKPSDILKQIFDTTGICHIALTEVNGMQKTARLYRLLELVYEIESDTTLSFHEIINQLIDMMDTDDPRLANINISSYGADAVKIMTIHKSKGLEAPVIFIIDSHKGEKSYAPSYYAIREKNGIIIPYKETGGFYSLDREIIIENEDLRENCETERLRYVASTRAKNILAICVPEEKDSFNGSFDSTLKDLNSIINIEARPIERTTKKKKQDIDIKPIFEKYNKEKEASIVALNNVLREHSSPFTNVHQEMDYDFKDYASGKYKSRGVEFGNMIHRLMEKYIIEPDFNFNAVYDDWMEEESLDNKYKTDVVLSFEKLRMNPLVKEALFSEKKYSEWEFYIKKNDKIIAGVIDTVYKAPNYTWVILDYKTDDISNPKRKAKLTTLYQKQLNIYKNCFEELTGNKVERGEIVWVE